VSGTTSFPFSVAEALAEAPIVNVVDVGAMDIGDDAVWQPLADEGLARVVGFEPVADECAQLNAIAGPAMRFLPYAVGDGTERTLHITRYSACSSLYEPNMPFLELFQDLAPLMEVVATPRVQTRRMDDIVELREHGCDFLKLDIQGAERDTLSHATQLLTQVMVVQTEVSFTPLYRDAPMVGEIDSLLRSRGFIVHRFLSSGGRTLAPSAFRSRPPNYMSQTLWADVVYVKDFTDPATQPAQNWVKLAVIMHCLYDARDLAWLALSHADRLSGSDLASDYRAAGEVASRRSEGFRAGNAPPRQGLAAPEGWWTRFRER
jgi:FkbM family methyltransferase